MGYRTSTYRAPTYTKTFTKSYSSSTTTTKATVSQPTKTYITTTRPKTVINTTIVHQPVYGNDWGWHSPVYSTPLVVGPVIATQPVMDVGQPIPQPIYYGDSFGTVGLIALAVIVAVVATVVIRRAV